MPTAQVLDQKKKINKSAVESVMEKHTLYSAHGVLHA
jgi:hypothetical protein